MSRAPLSPCCCRAGMPGQHSTNASAPFSPRPCVTSRSWRSTITHSTDETELQLREIAKRDPRFRVLRAPRPGLVPALRFGLEQTKSDCVARMDSDDRMHPRRLELQRRYLVDHPHVSALGSRVRIFPEDGMTEGLRTYLRWLNGCISADAIARDIYLESPLAHPSVMFRRTEIIDGGGYREGPFPDDYELWLRLAAKGRVLSKLPQTLLEWRDSPARTSRRDPRYSREAFRSSSRRMSSKRSASAASPQQPSDLGSGAKHAEARAPPSRRGLPTPSVGR